MTSTPTLVFLDLECTGFMEPDIVQLSAVDEAAHNSFDEYLLPRKPFEPMATVVNGLSIGQDGKMYKRHEANGSAIRVQDVMARDAREVLLEFVQWMGRLKGEKKVIVAHNGFT
jgi:hypothetical protein